MQPRKADRFRGINNRLPADRLRQMGDRDPGDFVADAVNVDLTDAGTFQSRPGYERVGLDTGCRGLTSHGGYGYYAAGNQMRRRSPDGTTISIGALASPFAPVSHAETPRGLIISDTFVLRLVKDDAMVPLAPSEPNPQPVVSIASGGLAAGKYSLMFATVDADGVRSRFTYPVEYTVGDSAALLVVAAAGVEVFATPMNASTFYSQGVSTGSPMALATIDTAAEPVVHRVLAPLPAGHVLGYHKGRLLSANGSMIAASLPYNLGLHHPMQDYFSLGAPVALMASLDEGLWVATTEMTWFLPGDDPLNSKPQQQAPFGAVPGTLTRIPNSAEWMWFSPRGQVRTQGGQLTLMQDDRIAFPHAETGAGIVREQNGLRTFVTALTGASPNGGAVMGSFMDAEVIKKE